MLVNIFVCLFVVLDSDETSQRNLGFRRKLHAAQHRGKSQVQKAIFQYKLTKLPVFKFQNICFICKNIQISTSLLLSKQLHIICLFFKEKISYNHMIEFLYAARIFYLLSSTTSPDLIVGFYKLIWNWRPSAAYTWRTLHPHRSWIKWISNYCDF